MSAPLAESSIYVMVSLAAWLSDWATLFALVTVHYTVELYVLTASSLTSRIWFIIDDIVIVIIIIIVIVIINVIIIDSIVVVAVVVVVTTAVLVVVAVMYSGVQKKWHKQIFF